MGKSRFAVAVVVSVLGGVPLLAQLGVIERGKPTTLRGEIVEISCYQKKGVSGGTGPDHIACAKDCASKGQALGILTEGDGLFRIVGNLTTANNAKLVPYIGQTVDLYGSQVLLSNTYDVRQNFDAQKIAAVKKGS
jgi:hypothetical protein